MSDLFRVDSVVKRFGGLTALNQVSLTVEAGKIYGLIGPNGSGKTTLLNVMTGVMKPNGGKIFFNGEEITGRPPHQVAKLGIGRTFQMPRVFSEMTVRENVLAVMRRGSDAGAADELMKTFHLDSVSDTRAGQLGYASKKHLELARVMALNPSLIMLDEPMAGLDLEMVSSMSSYVKELNKAHGKTLIVVEHNLEELLSIADYVIVLDHGLLLYEGEPQAIKDSNVVKAAYFGA